MTTETIRGTVTRVFYCAPESPSMAGVLKLDKGKEIRFAGKCAADQGDKLELTGEWGRHPTYGKQFEAATGLVKMDESPDALIHLLATDKRFKGLGPARAASVVEAALLLSEDGTAISAFTAHPDQVAQRAGVAVEIVQSAAEVWNERREYFAALAALGERGWSNGQAQTIVHVFGENAPTLVGSDPYILIGKIPRFGFRTVDAVARKGGVSPNDPMRLLAGVAFCLDRIASNGDTWTTREGILDKASQELRPDTLNGETLIAQALEDLIQGGQVHVDTSPLGTEVVADARIAVAEFEVFGRLMSGLREIPNRQIRLDGSRSQSVVPTLNRDQRAALEGFSNYKFGMISGGAGVGKTYTMRAVAEVAEDNGLSVELCAPTGKAARKLSHATGLEAKTIHRLLEPQFDQHTGAFSFLRGQHLPLDADLVIVDEVSMADVKLMRSLARALDPGGGGRDGARLLLVGDHHQIPSIGAGAVLRDLLGAQSRFPGAVHILNDVVRQAGVLARNTTAILDGVVVKENTAPWGITRTEKGHEEGGAAIVATVVEHLVTQTAPEPFNRQLDMAFDVQVLSPMKKGPLGTWALNVHLQKLRQRLLGNMPPPPTEVDKAPRPLMGDRVIWGINDYELDLFNGTQAVVVGLPKGGSMQLFTEDGREVTISAGKRKHVDVAYAMTVHKAQGSEWPAVVFVASSSHWIMHDRALFYTAASRAAESLTICGDPAGIKHFAETRKSATRQTFGSFLVHGWTPTPKV